MFNFYAATEKLLFYTVLFGFRQERTANTPAALQEIN
jgi:hypothetical protein